MALMRIQSIFTYQSMGGGQSYYFDVVVDQQGLVTVKNIRGPHGSCQEYGSPLPEEVTRDITTAVGLVRLLLSESSVVGGTVSFTGQTSRPVVIAPGLLNNTNYRVYLSPNEGGFLTVENKTIGGFDVVAASAYGSSADPKDVSWDVFVSTAQASVFGGTLTFPSGSVSQVITFPSPLTTDSYRVLLSPSDFFLARVSGKTKFGFTVDLGHDPSPGSVTVGYDVFA